MRRILLLVFVGLFSVSCSKQEVTSQKEKTREEIVKEVLEKKFDYPKYLEGRWELDDPRYGLIVPTLGFSFKNNEIYELKLRTNKTGTNIKNYYLDYRVNFQGFKDFFVKRENGVGIYYIYEIIKDKKTYLERYLHSFYVENGFLYVTGYDFTYGHYKARCKKVE